MNELVVTKRKREEDTHKTFSIRITNETYEALNEIARKTDRTRNELIQLFLDYSIENALIR